VTSGLIGEKSPKSPDSSLIRVTYPQKMSKSPARYPQEPEKLSPKKTKKVDERPKGNHAAASPPKAGQGELCAQASRFLRGTRDRISKGD
jgi:hypothetical protein